MLGVFNDIPVTWGALKTWMMYFSTISVTESALKTYVMSVTGVAAVETWPTSKMMRFHPAAYDEALHHSISAG